MNPEVWDRIEATLDRTTALAEKNEKKLDRLEEGLDRLESGLGRLEKTTAERTTAIFDTLDRIAKEREVEAKKAAEEREKVAKEREKVAKEREIEAKKAAEEREKVAKEREIEAKEHERMAKERDESLTRLENTVDKMCNAVSGVKEELKGISDSNGMVAEDYFYASLDKSKTLGGIHFDIVEKNMRSARKQKDGSKLSGQYDIVLINDNAVCLIEVKYRVRVEDLLDVVDKDVGVFKTLFPQYADYQIYLAVGGMTFEEDAVSTAKKLGMGVLQLDGDAVVVYDKDLKVY